MQQLGEPRFPFTAIVGQRAMKRALVLNTINPKVGGVLIRGKKGTAKSTAVRSLAALLPEVSVPQGCPYSCVPDRRQGLCERCEPEVADDTQVTRQVRIVELPVGATEDRLVGSLDIEQAIKSGSRSFEPGVIAAAHRGILYIDEVNLLNDHLVDVLLDAAAMGRNYVEREGISISHAAEFILVGTMNPEEGDLRPQLLDRFGLAVEVDTVFAPQERREVVLRRIAYEADPYGFMSQWREEESKERDRILRGQEMLPEVVVGDDMLELITDICIEYQVDGLRADIVIYKASSTIAAYDGRTQVSPDDVKEAAQMALLHRQRRQPFQQPHLDTDRLDEMVEEHQNRPRDREPQEQTGEREDGGDSDDDSGAPAEERFEIGETFNVRPLQVPGRDNLGRRASGRRARTVSSSTAGRYVGAKVPQEKASDLALDATLRAAAPHQSRRRAAESETARPATADRKQNEFLIEPWDLREKVRETKTGNLILFVVDASGSMGSQRRMVAVKGAILSLLLDAYQRRDKVGMIAFRGADAELLLPPTGSVELAEIRLQELPTGGRTPLSRGLQLAMEVIETEKLKDTEMLPLLVLVSDGRANLAMGDGSPMDEAKAMAASIQENHIPSVTLDSEMDYIKFGLAQSIAEALGGEYLMLEDLRADSLVQAVRTVTSNLSGAAVNLS